MPPRLIRYLQERLNPVEARILAKNKQLFRQRMEEAGLPVVREVLTLDHVGVIRDSAGAVLDAGAAAVLLQEGEFFAKPTDGTYGRGARVIRPGDDVPAFLAEARNTIVQPRIRQHPLLDRLYPHAVNTVRIDTMRDGARWISNAAVLKLGVDGSIVDNGSAGGLIVGVNIETGTLRPFGRQRMKFGDRLYTHHPTTGSAFEGLVLPHWDLLRETIRRAAEAALPLESLGWDVVITETGVILLEANDKWCANLFQAGWGGLGNTPVGQLARINHGN
nr:sugar-transfer associated ATP-grasp domain-containing protein [Pararhodobacter sp. SW119]